MDVPIPAFNTLEPLVRLVNNASLHELADIQDSFRMRLNSQGSGSEMRSFTPNTRSRSGVHDSKRSTIDHKAI